MPNIHLQKFDGGQAEDIRTFATDENEKSLNFDIFTNPHKLFPYRDMIAETVTGKTITDLSLNGVVNDNLFYWTVGRTSSGSAVPTFYYKTAINDPWTVGNSGEANSTIINGTLVLYKGIPYCLAIKSTGVLILINGSTGSTVGTSAVVTTQSFTPQPFVHPEDNVLYMVNDNVLGRWDGTTYSEIITLIPSGSLVTSLTKYGSYLAIACNLVKFGSGGAIVYLWGRDMTLNTFQGEIPFGDNFLVIIENLGNTIVGIAFTTSPLSTADDYFIDVMAYSGGAVETVKSIKVEEGSQSAFRNFKTKYKDTLYFSIRTDNSIYSLRKNKEGNWAVTKDRYAKNSTTFSTSDKILTVIGGILWVAFASAGGGSGGSFYRTEIASEATFASRSVYLTSINPGMPLADRNSLKQLEAVRISYTGKTNGTVRLLYAIDGSTLTGTADPAASTTLTGTNTLFLTEVAVGDSIMVNLEIRTVTAIASNTSLTVSEAFTNTPAGSIYRMRAIVSETTTAIEGTKEATMQNDGNALLEGREFQFQIESTGGVEIKEIEYEYKVVNTQL